ncbi:unnamed protein product [Closterium sp. Naga37s-1]|nr:unnamed protein product [Closterium sp. Naga37s-1]
MLQGDCIERQPDHIVVAVTLSEEGRGLIQWTISRCQPGDVIYVLHVIVPPTDGARPPRLEEMREDQRRKLEIFSALLWGFEALCDEKKVAASVRVVHGACEEQAVADEARLLGATRVVVHKDGMGRRFSPRALEQRLPPACMVLFVGGGRLALAKRGKGGVGAAVGAAEGKSAGNRAAAGDATPNGHRPLYIPLMRLFGSSSKDRDGYRDEGVAAKGGAGEKAKVGARESVREREREQGREREVKAAGATSSSSARSSKPYHGGNSGSSRSASGAGASPHPTARSAMHASSMSQGPSMMGSGISRSGPLSYHHAAASGAGSMSGPHDRSAPVAAHAAAAGGSGGARRLAQLPRSNSLTSLRQHPASHNAKPSIAQRALSLLQGDVSFPRRPFASGKARSVCNSPRASSPHASFFSSSFSASRPSSPRASRPSSPRSSAFNSFFPSSPRSSRPSSPRASAGNPQFSPFVSPRATAANPFFPPSFDPSSRAAATDGRLGQRQQGQQQGGGQQRQRQGQQQEQGSSRSAEHMPKWQLLRSSITGKQQPQQQMQQQQGQQAQQQAQQQHQQQQQQHLRDGSRSFESQSAAVTPRHMRVQRSASFAGVSAVAATLAQQLGWEHEAEAAEEEEERKAREQVRRGREVAQGEEGRRGEGQQSAQSELNARLVRLQQQQQQMEQGGRGMRGGEGKVSFYVGQGQQEEAMVRADIASAARDAAIADRTEGVDCIDWANRCDVETASSSSSSSDDSSERGDANNADGLDDAIQGTVHHCSFPSMDASDAAQPVLESFCSDISATSAATSSSAFSSRSGTSSHWTDIPSSGSLSTPACHMRAAGRGGEEARGEGNSGQENQGHERKGQDGKGHGLVGEAVARERAEAGEGKEDARCPVLVGRFPVHRPRQRAGVGGTMGGSVGGWSGGSGRRLSVLNKTRDPQSVRRIESESESERDRDRARARARDFGRVRREGSGIGSERGMCAPDACLLADGGSEGGVSEREGGESARDREWGFVVRAAGVGETGREREDAGESAEEVSADGEDEEETEREDGREADAGEEVSERRSSEARSEGREVRETSSGEGEGGRQAEGSREVESGAEGGVDPLPCVRQQSLPVSRSCSSLVPSRRYFSDGSEQARRDGRRDVPAMPQRAALGADAGLHGGDGWSGAGLGRSSSGGGGGVAARAALASPSPGVRRSNSFTQGARLTTAGAAAAQAAAGVEAVGAVGAGGAGAWEGPWRKLQWCQVEQATDGFATRNLLGTCGGYSRVYQGRLPGGQQIAVRREMLSCATTADGGDAGCGGAGGVIAAYGARQGGRPRGGVPLAVERGLSSEVAAELAVLATLSHRHVAQLVGVCAERRDEVALVFEHMEGGTLESALRGNSGSAAAAAAAGNPGSLPWTVRPIVARQLALALHYLHEGAPRAVVHRNVRAASVMLTRGGEVKLSEFGLALFAANNDAPMQVPLAGTFGYLAPEYLSHGAVSTHTDVFAFGVVLLELLSGQPPVDDSRPRGMQCLVQWARPLIEEGRLHEVADPALQGGYHPHQFALLARTALLCTHKDPSQRPSMLQVLHLIDSGPPATPSGSPGVLRGDDVEFDIDFHLHELPSRSRHATSATGARYAATDVTSAGEWREVAELKLALGALVGRVTAELAKAGVAVGLGKSEVKAERRAERKVRLSPAVSRLVSGAVAGGVSRTATAPLETIRTHMMCGRGGLAANGSMTAVFQWVLRTEGWTGLFRGNAINVLRVAPSKAIEMLTYDTVKRFLTPKEGRPSIIPRQLPIPISSIAGSSAGIASCLLTYPLELVKTRLTVNPDMYRGVLHAFHRIIMEQGVGELYRGVAPSVVGMIPYAGANFYAYDTLCTAYRKARGREEIEPLMTLVIGSTAGCFAAASTFPLEVARKHLQMGATGGRVAYTGMLQCMRSIVREQGVKGLYRGVVPSCAKMMPAAGISFMCYEVLKRVLIEDEKVR